MAVTTEVVTILYSDDGFSVNVHGIFPDSLISKRREYWNSILLISEAISALACCPLFGHLLDVSGTRQAPYLFGIMLLFASMVIFTASHTVTWYIIARVLQGAATAMVSVAGLAIMTDVVDKASLGQTIGYLGTAMTLGLISGPLLGGVVYGVGGFYAVFGMAFGIIALDFFLRLAVIEKRSAERWLCLTDGERPSQENGYIPEQPPYGTMGTIASNGHSATEIYKNTFALGKLLKQPRILISLWAVIVGALVVSAFDATLPVFVEDTFQWSVLGAGLIFLPGASVAIFQPFFEFLSDRLGSRVIACASFVILGPSLICLRFVGENSPSHIALLGVLLGLIGMWIDSCKRALIMEIQRILDDMEAEDPWVFGGRGAVAQAFSLENMARFGGLGLGPMVGGFVEFQYGWKVMTLGLGVLSAITAMPMLWLSGPTKDVSWTESADEEMEREFLLGE
ncbi:Major facilitator superfamily domain, general substrate transporter [Penicillium griseofulvum]|uniref:Major facilitator superfamily domain, general substrate transporter n=1 Tax=Penicillium patulum TaxID=5078 RepID=A0A135LLH5_PENPA|nr:Major facilitator superfamily domain, general substrate transporter [Penicillium griseofulvum]KXG49822.1 Major facilitator superfamily domain, general substrate transporter [Penicillium griseofulvum]